MSTYAVSGTGTMLSIGLRTGWKSVAAWTVGIIAMMVVTASSIVALYDTPEKLATYAASISGGSTLLLNGDVAGLETIGGVFANEFGFVLAFGVPLMAIALAARGTRREEESGRLELLLAARIGRHAPIVSAILLAFAALAVVALGCAAAMIGYGADAAGSVAYGLAILGLGAVFLGVTVVAAQVFEHNRSVWAVGLSIAVASYLVRGVGAMQESPIVWLSPHAWADQVRAFGQTRYWPLLVSFGVAAALVALGAWLNTRRDVDSALVRPRPAAASASPLLRSPVGLATYEHRGSIIGWTVICVALMATYGSLTQEVLDAITSNPALGEMLGADQAAAENLLATVMSTFVMMLAVFVAAFVVMALNALRKEESSARLEADLSGDRSRWAWLGTHVAVIVFGALVIGALGAAALGATAASSMGDGAWFGDLFTAAAVFAPSVAFFVGLGVALFGLRPRWQAATWGVFAVAALVAYLGPGLNLPQGLIDLSPFAAVGANAVVEGASTTGSLVVWVVSIALVVAGFLGFRRRNVPVG